MVVSRYRYLLLAVPILKMNLYVGILASSFFQYFLYMYHQRIVYSVQLCNHDAMNFYSLFVTTMSPCH